MRNFIINNCMSYIKRNNDYNDIKLKEIEYGIVGIYLTISKVIIIFALAILLNIFKEVLIFMIFFNIIRTTAFGLHATKSWRCLVSSTISFIGIPLICIYISVDNYLKVIIGIICTILIFKNSPADTYKRPIINKKRRLIYKTLSTIISTIYFCIAIIIKDSFISNCLIFSIILECFFISPLIYKLFKLPYNNYISYIEKHPELINKV